MRTLALLTLAAAHRYDTLFEQFLLEFEKVYSEAVADAGGERPLYMRVDLILDKQGRVWLGERESWGADVSSVVREKYVGKPVPEEKGKILDPTYKELTIRMIRRTKQNLRELHKKSSSSTPAKRRSGEPLLTPSPSKAQPRRSNLIDSATSTPSKPSSSSTSKRKFTELSSTPTPSKRRCVEA